MLTVQGPDSGNSSLRAHCRIGSLNFVTSNSAERGKRRRCPVAVGSTCGQPNCVPCISFLCFRNVKHAILMCCTHSRTFCTEIRVTMVYVCLCVFRFAVWCWEHRALSGLELFKATTCKVKADGNYTYSFLFIVYRIGYCVRNSMST